MKSYYDPICDLLLFGQDVIITSGSDDEGQIPTEPDE